MAEPSACPDPAHSSVQQSVGSQSSARVFRPFSGFLWQLAALAAVLLAFCLSIVVTRDEKPPELTPLEAPRLSTLEEFQGEFRDRLLWGTYRPGLYFGMRTRLPMGLQTGLMWFDPDKPDAHKNIRHQAQERDGLRKFGWERHDGEAFGRQELSDGNLHVTTSFAKRFCKFCRAGNSLTWVGGDWAVRVEVRETKGAQKPQKSDDLEGVEQQRASILFYVANEGPHSGRRVHLQMQPQQDSLLLASGNTSPLGGWQLHAFSVKGEEKSIKPLYGSSGPSGLTTAGGRPPRMHFTGIHSHHTHNLTELLAAQFSMPLATLGGSRGLQRFAGGRVSTLLPDQVEADSNVGVFQVTGKLPFAVDFVFTGSLPPPQRQSGGILGGAARSLSALLGRSVMSQPEWPEDPAPLESLQERLAALSGERLTVFLRQSEARFDRKFDATFTMSDEDRMPAGEQ